MYEKSEVSLKFATDQKKKKNFFYGFTSNASLCQQPGKKFDRCKTKEGRAGGTVFVSYASCVPNKRGELGLDGPPLRIYLSLPPLSLFTQTKTMEVLIAQLHVDIVSFITHKYRKITNTRDYTGRDGYREVQKSVYPYASSAGMVKSGVSSFKTFSVSSGLIIQRVQQLDRVAKSFPVDKN